MNFHIYNMSKHILFIILVLSFPTISKGNSDTLFAKLVSIAEHRDQYISNKEERITKLKNELTVETSNDLIYLINKELYNEYKKYNIDSAIYYTEKNIKLANSSNRRDWLFDSQLQMVTLYSTSGRFLESREMLENIDRSALNADLLPKYYETSNQFYSQYKTNNGDNQYANKVQLYLDSLVLSEDPTTMKHQNNLAEQMIEKKAYDKAELLLLKIIENTSELDANYAMAAYLLGQVYGFKQDKGKEQKYYAMSAISDIKNSLRDNASMFNLALLYYNSGEIDKAYQLTKFAINDAVLCKVMFRTGQMYEYFNIMNASFLDQSKKQQEQLRSYLLLISILSIILIFALIGVYKQMKKVSKIRELLVELNKKIRKTNEQLNESNVKLTESNLIKEEYIAHFFDLCSDYIAKIEEYRKTLNKRVANNQFDELAKDLKSTKIIDGELDALYYNFDHIFIKLYPSFVDDFNAMLIPEERIVLKSGELLNNELRIFALIRLGITDSIKIASFLRYSVSTIYNYRSSIKNKVIVPREDFMNLLMKIGAKTEESAKEKVLPKV